MEELSQVLQKAQCAVWSVQSDLATLRMHVDESEVVNPFTFDLHTTILQKQEAAAELLRGGAHQLYQSLGEVEEKAQAIGNVRSKEKELRATKKAMQRYFEAHKQHQDEQREHYEGLLGLQKYKLTHLSDDTSTALRRSADKLLRHRLLMRWMRKAMLRAFARHYSEKEKDSLATLEAVATRYAQHRFDSEIRRKLFYAWGRRVHHRVLNRLANAHDELQRENEVVQRQAGLSQRLLRSKEEEEASQVLLSRHVQTREVELLDKEIDRLKVALVEVTDEFNERSRTFIETREAMELFHRRRETELRNTISSMHMEIDEQRSQTRHGMLVAESLARRTCVYFATSDNLWLEAIQRRQTLFTETVSIGCTRLITRGQQTQEELSRLRSEVDILAPLSEKCVSLENSLAHLGSAYESEKEALRRIDREARQTERVTVLLLEQLHDSKNAHLRLQYFWRWASSAREQSRLALENDRQRLILTVEERQLDHATQVQVIEVENREVVRRLEKALRERTHEANELDRNLHQLQSDKEHLTSVMLAQQIDFHTLSEQLAEQQDERDRLEEQSFGEQLQQLGLEETRLRSRMEYKELGWRHALRQRELDLLKSHYYLLVERASMHQSLCDQWHHQCAERATTMDRWASQRLAAVVTTLGNKHTHAIVAVYFAEWKVGAVAAQRRRQLTDRWRMTSELRRLQHEQREVELVAAAERERQALIAGHDAIVERQHAAHLAEKQEWLRLRETAVTEQRSDLSAAEEQLSLAHMKVKELASLMVEYCARCSLAQWRMWLVHRQRRQDKEHHFKWANSVMGWFSWYMRTVATYWQVKRDELKGVFELSFGNGCGAGPIGPVCVSASTHTLHIQQENADDAELNEMAGAGCVPARCCVKGYTVPASDTVDVFGPIHMRCFQWIEVHAEMSFEHTECLEELFFTAARDLKSPVDSVSLSSAPSGDTGRGTPSPLSISLDSNEWHGDVEEVDGISVTPASTCNRPAAAERRSPDMGGQLQILRAEVELRERQGKVPTKSDAILLQVVVDTLILITDSPTFYSGPVREQLQCRKWERDVFALLRRAAFLMISSEHHTTTCAVEPTNDAVKNPSDLTTLVARHEAMLTSLHQFLDERRHNEYAVSRMLVEVESFSHQLLHHYERDLGTLAGREATRVPTTVKTDPGSFATQSLIPIPSAVLCDVECSRSASFPCMPSHTVPSGHLSPSRTHEAEVSAPMTTLHLVKEHEQQYNLRYQEELQQARRDTEDAAEFRFQDERERYAREVAYLLATIEKNNDRYEQERSMLQRRMEAALERCSEEREQTKRCFEVTKARFEEGAAELAAEVAMLRRELEGEPERITRATQHALHQQRELLSMEHDGEVVMLQKQIQHLQWEKDSQAVQSAQKEEELCRAVEAERHTLIKVTQRHAVEMDEIASNYHSSVMKLEDRLVDQRRMSELTSRYAQLQALYAHFFGMSGEEKMLYMLRVVTENAGRVYDAVSLTAPSSHVPADMVATSSPNEMLVEVCEALEGENLKLRERVAYLEETFQTPAKEEVDSSSQEAEGGINWLRHSASRATAEIGYGAASSSQRLDMPQQCEISARGSSDTTGPPLTNSALVTPDRARDRSIDMADLTHSILRYSRRLSDQRERNEERLHQADTLANEVTDLIARGERLEQLLYNLPSDNGV